MKEIFIIGSKGIPANYGGYETFVENLTKRKLNNNINYHVSCLASDNKEFYYNDSHCFNVKVPNIGPAKAVLYDYKAFKYCLKYIKENKIKNAIIYVLTCRIGIVYKRLILKSKKLGVKVFLNPDGHEWKRSKWPWFIKKYWKYSEKKMVKYSDLIICDSLNIEKYIKSNYQKYNPKTTYIAYGADVSKSNIADNDHKLLDFYDKYNIKKDNYYLIVGRFVPENNYELMIREFMKSHTKKDLVIITNVSNNKLFKRLESNYSMSKDSRIKFVGTIYDDELLKKIRENAFAYIHGHSVGGTNPSLLEALASTKINILYDVGFNRECGRESCLYFNNVSCNLSNIINYCDNLDDDSIKKYNFNSLSEIKKRYYWNDIVSTYENTFMNGE